MTSLGQTCNVRRGKRWQTYTLRITFVSLHRDFHITKKSRWWCANVLARSIPKTFCVASPRSEQTRVEAILGCKIYDFQDCRYLDIGSVHIGICYIVHIGICYMNLYPVDLNHIIDRNHRSILSIPSPMIHDMLEHPQAFRYVCVTPLGPSLIHKVTLMMKKIVSSLNS